jgi:hypothetical protein
VQLKGADILQSKLSGGLSEVLGKARNGSDIGTLGMGRQVPNLHVLKHALT